MLRRAAVVILLAGPAIAQDGLVSYDASDSRMTAAIFAAQESLPGFLEVALEPNGTSRDGYLMKVGFPTERDPTSLEHIWVGPFAQLKNGKFVGFLDNEPVDLGDLDLGDQVPFSADMVSDWTYRSERGLAYGQFTTRVIFEDGEFGDTPFNQLFEPEPIPSDWDQ
ncbi:MAG: DUF2314 domain-containing protein [Tabrizicola sp.]|jgi:uncharacterized protein YegJ (DUF2314 family)|nr:DUF2314 domain-containing protein [Tabrizicola sp.]